jgi:membrane protease YdiL (CAAX protease family)
VSPATSLWVRVSALTGLSVALLLLVTPPQPERRVAWLGAIAAGLGCGTALYVAATRCRPRLPGSRSSAGVGLAAQAFLGLLAANEEIVWRRFILGELLGAGVVAAVLISTLGFAFAHRSRRGLHLGTGAVFGALYAATGALAASVIAHWAYNALVGALVDHRRLVRSTAL